ncbi:MAG: tetratricopeptide repeat protein [Candidatus Omnitrophica bacterium]|nr:tetratricopeptide repeat protein [Candidatus Omnitrophota bacterium]
MENIGNDTRLRRFFLDKWHPYLWIIFIGLLLYFKTLSFDFSFFDDQELIVDNGLFLGDIFNILRAFCMKVYPNNLAMPYYRPILIVSFILNAQAGGTAPFAYHLTNVLIHISVASLVYILFQRLSYRKDLSFFAAMIFLVHPTLTQAVAWIPGRNDSLLAAFAVASFIFFLKFIDLRRSADYLLHLFFLALALFTKESAVIVIAMYYLYLLLVKGPRALSRGFRPLILGHAAVLMLWSIPRHFVLTGALDINPYDMGRLIAFQLPAIVQLLGKTVFPLRQSVFATMQDTHCAYGLFTIAVVGALMIFFKKKPYGTAIFGAAWLILFLVPTLIRPHAPIISDVLEHRLYLPIIGLMIMLAEIDVVKKKFSLNNRLCAVAAFCIILLFSVRTYAHSDNFRNSLVFWENAVAASSRSAFSHMKLGELYYRADRLDEAFSEISRGLELDHQFTRSGHYYLGFIYLKKGMSLDAEKEFRKTIALMPDNDWAYMALGVICYKSGRHKEAEKLWLKSFEINPSNFETLRNLAIFCAEQGDYRSARFYAERLEKLGAEPPEGFLKEINSK